MDSEQIKARMESLRDRYVAGEMRHEEWLPQKRSLLAQLKEAREREATAALAGGRAVVVAVDDADDTDQWLDARSAYDDKR